MKFVIVGRPATKKNHGQIVHVKGRHVMLPAKAYAKYEKEAKKILQAQYNKSPITDPVIVVCQYWLPDKRYWPDLIGLLQATSDILQAAKISTDDQQIMHYGDSRIAGIDKARPRVEIEVVKLIHDYKMGET